MFRTVIATNLYYRDQKPLIDKLWPEHNIAVLVMVIRRQLDACVRVL